MDRSRFCVFFKIGCYPRWTEKENLLAERPFLPIPELYLIVIFFLPFGGVIALI